jgi:hypothetical protein
MREALRRHGLDEKLAECRSERAEQHERSELRIVCQIRIELSRVQLSVPVVFLDVEMRSSLVYP